jgi:hypothetical protein
LTRVSKYLHILANDGSHYRGQSIQVPVLLLHEDYQVAWILNSSYLTVKRKTDERRNLGLFILSLQHRSFRPSGKATTVFSIFCPTA